MTVPALMKFMERVPSDTRLIVNKVAGEGQGVNVILAHRYGSTSSMIWSPGFIAKLSLSDESTAADHITGILEDMLKKLDEDVRTRMARVLVTNEYTGKCWVCDTDTSRMAQPGCFCSERCRRIAWMIKNPKSSPKEYEDARFPH